MERWLEEASVRGKNECQVKLVDTEKGFGSHFRSGLHFFYVLKSGYEKKLFHYFSIKKYHQG